MSTPTAIVIDDQPEQGAQLAGILTRLGVRVIDVLESGTTALATLRSRQPTIATIDIQMPGVNGLDIVRGATDEQLPTILVVCSGTSQIQVQDQAIAAGARAFIGKPYDHVIIARDLKAILEA